MLPLLFLTISSLATAYVLPSTTPPTASLDDKCTFTLWHRQQESRNYIQLNKIVDHANDITVDVTSLRPVTAFNSYTRLSNGQAFAVAGLLDDERLTITRSDGDVLRFEVGEMRWSSLDAYGGEGKAGASGWAWCEVGQWQGETGRRERRLECAFACEKVSNGDLRDEFGGVREGDGQVRIDLY